MEEQQKSGVEKLINLQQSELNLKGVYIKMNKIGIRQKKYEYSRGGECINFLLFLYQKYQLQNVN